MAALRRTLNIAPRLMRSTALLHTKPTVFRALGNAAGNGSISNTGSSSGSGSNTFLSPMGSLFGDLDRMFGFGSPQQHRGSWMMDAPFKDFPPLFKTFANMDISETEANHVITMDCPGMKVDQIKIQLDKNNILSVSGERRTETEEHPNAEKGDGNNTDANTTTNNNNNRRNVTVYRSERQYGKFSRAVQLPENVDRNSVQACMKDGVLKITIPKLQREEKNDTISIDIKNE